MKYKTIIKLMNKINSTMSFKELIETIIDSAKAALEAEGASLLLADRERRELIFDVVISEQGRIIQGKRLPFGKGIAGHSAKSEVPIISNDVSLDDRFYNGIDASTGFKTRSALAVPLKNGDKLIGVLEAVNSAKENGFGGDDIEMLSCIADAAAIAISKNELLTDLSSRINELTCIYEISQSIYSSTDVELLLTKVVNEISRVMRADKCSFTLLTGDCESVAYYVSNTKVDYDVTLGNTFINHVAKTGDPLLVYDVDEDYKFRDRKKLGVYKSRSFACIPMKIRDQVAGVLSVTDKADGSAFSSFDLQVLSTISQQVAEMLDNVRNYNAEIERKRIEHDLTIAAEIQKQSLSNFPDSIGDITLGGFIRPARYIGGDFFDVSESSDGKISVSIGDISGKGIPAALFLSTVRNSLRQEMLKNIKPEVLLAGVNRLVNIESYNGMFCTFFYALIDREKRTIVYSSAGHNPQLFYKSDEDRFIEINTKGCPLGVFKDRHFGSDVIQYNRNDMLILFTDGFADPGGYSEITIEFLYELIRKNRDLSAKEISEKVNEEAERQAANGERFDDSTFLVVKMD